MLRKILAAMRLLALLAGDENLEGGPEGSFGFPAGTSLDNTRVELGNARGTVDDEAGVARVDDTLARVA